MNNRKPPKVMAKALIKILRKAHPDSLYLKMVFSHIRKELELPSTRTPPKRLPELLTEQEIQSFYEVVWHGANESHIILIKLLLYTGIRNSEAAHITVGDVDINALKIRIEQGKGGKDRYVPFPQFFQGELNQYLLNQKKSGAKYLFETNRNKLYSSRWIRKIIKRYSLKAKIEKRIYPHLFRHQLLTFLTQKGIIDTKIQQISGHSDRNSLAVYQNLSLADVEPQYQAVMQTFPLK